MKSLPSKLVFVVGAILFVACGRSGFDLQQRDAAGVLPASDAGLEIDAGIADAAAFDSDNDGIIDSVDNCVAIPNAAQYDEDVDGVGDLCDNCPQSSNPAQEDVGETQNAQMADSIGDACDPRPAQSGDVQVLFLGFNDAAELTPFSTGGIQNFEVRNGQLQQRLNSDLALIWQNDLNVVDGTVEARVTYRNVGLDSGYPLRGIAVLAMFHRGVDFGRGIGCGEIIVAGASPEVFSTAAWYGNGGYANIEVAAGEVSEGRTITYKTHTSNSDTVDCEAGQESGQATIASGFTGTGVAISLWGTGMDMDYLVLYSR